MKALNFQGGSSVLAEDRDTYSTAMFFVVALCVLQIRPATFPNMMICANRKLKLQAATSAGGASAATAPADLAHLEPPPTLDGWLDAEFKLGPSSPDRPLMSWRDAKASQHAAPSQDDVPHYAQHLRITSVGVP